MGRIIPKTVVFRGRGASGGLVFTSDTHERPRKPRDGSLIFPGKSQITLKHVLLTKLQSFAVFCRVPGERPAERGTECLKKRKR